MRKLLFILTCLLAILTAFTLILGGCSSTTTVTATTTTTITTSATAPSSSVPPTTSAPPTTTSSPTTSVSAAPIKIGFMGFMSGPGASVSTYQIPALQMLIDNVNASGGLLGRKMELVTSDDTGDPSIVVNKADYLKSQGCVGVVGASYDPTTDTLSAWAKDNKVIIVNPSATDMSLRTTAFNKYTFLYWTPGVVYGKIMAEYVASKLPSTKSVYCIATDITVNHNMYDAFWQRMNVLKPGINNLGSLFTGGFEMDFSTAISAALSKKPDLLLEFVGGPSGPNFVKQAMQFNLFSSVNKVLCLAATNASSTDSFGKDFPVGVIDVTTAPFWLDTPEMKAFTTEFNKRSKLYPSDMAINSYNCALSLVEAIKKANSLDPDAIVSALETVTIANSPIGSFSYNDYDHQANAPVWVVISAFSPDYPIAVGTIEAKYQQGIYPTRAEIEALKAGK